MMTNYYTPKVKNCVNCGGKFRRKYPLLLEGENYCTQCGYFCSGKCSKEFGISCAEEGVRRLGQSLVRYNRGDRRAS